MTGNVFVSGAFDNIQSHQIRFLEEAAKLGPVTAVLWSDDLITRALGKPPKFPEAERLYLLQSIRFINEVKFRENAVDANALPEAMGTHATWAVQKSEDNPQKRAFCKSAGLNYQVIDDAKVIGSSEPEQVLHRSGERRVIVTGCYDWFHSGHVRFFEECSSHGDLYVVVGHDANIRLLKGEGRPLFPQAERRYVVSAIRFVKQALISSGHGWLDAEPEMKVIQPHVYAVNEDGDVPEKRDYCQKQGIEYLVLKRAPARGLPRRSSTDLRGY
jgi:cytidyltransferase-like protein